MPKRMTTRTTWSLVAGVGVLLQSVLACVGDLPSIDPNDDDAGPDGTSPLADSGGSLADGASFRDSDAVDANPTDDAGGADGADGAPESGVDAAADADGATEGPDAAFDAPPDAPPPPCDRGRGFGGAAPVLLGGNPLVARFFRIARGGARAYYIPDTSGGEIKAADITAGPLTTIDGVSTAMPQSSYVGGGFAIAGSERELVVVFGGNAALRMTRTSASVAFSSAGAETVVFTPPPPATPSDAMFEPALGASGSLFFTYVRRPDVTGPFFVDLHVGSMGAGVIGAVPVVGVKPPASFQSFAVPASDTHLFLARWGAGPGDLYPRIFESTRADASAPWLTPTPVPIGGLTLAADDAVVPFGTSDDGCHLYFGKVTASVSGPFQVFHAQR